VRAFVCWHVVSSLAFAADLTAASGRGAGSFSARRLDQRFTLATLPAAYGKIRTPWRPTTQGYAKWSQIKMPSPVAATLCAISMLLASGSVALTQTMPKEGETWQLKMDGFGCAKNGDLDRLLQVRRSGDQAEFAALLLRLRGEGLCQDLPKGLQVVVDRIESYGMLNDRPCVRQSGRSACWYTLPAFLQPMRNQ
jgi:hypothetical protein